MAVYKVPQDVEAEDHILGPLTLRQFIFAIIFALATWTTWMLIRVNVLLALPMLPILAIAGFLAAPVSRQQPNEVWLTAMLHYYLKPRRRIWDQSGLSQLVKITAPKRDDHTYTDGLSQYQVQSRLKLLANTLDSRGWAVKNISINQYIPTNMIQPTQVTDRLIGQNELPQEVNPIDIREADDIMSPGASQVSHHFDDLLRAEHEKQRQSLQTRMQQAVRAGHTPQPQTPPATAYSTPPISPAAPSIASPPNTLAPTPQQPLATDDIPAVTPSSSPVILSLAHNSDLSVDTISREVNKSVPEDELTDDEVINLR